MSINSREAWRGTIHILQNDPDSAEDVGKLSIEGNSVYHEDMAGEVTNVDGATALPRSMLV